MAQSLTRPLATLCGRAQRGNLYDHKPCCCCRPCPTEATWGCLSGLFVILCRTEGEPGLWVEQYPSSGLGSGISTLSLTAFRGLTFSQSDIGIIYNFRPAVRAAAWSEGVKHDAPDNLCVSHAVLFTSENSSDSCGGSSVCFPGVSSSSGTNDFLFPCPVCLLGDG